MTVANSNAQDESDQLDSDEDEDITVDKTKPAKVKSKTRRGATITAEMKKNWKKMTKVSSPLFFLSRICTDK